MHRSLVIDDSGVVRKVARRLLERLDFEVMEAGTGPQAIEVCRQTMPELVLVDWHMPPSPSVELIMTLRQLPGGKGPVILYCTSELDTVEIARALAAGADDYVMTPLDRTGLIAKLTDTGLMARQGA